MKRIFFAFLYLLLTSCGTNDSALLDDEANTPKIYLTKNLGSQRAIIVSSPLDGESAEICEIQQGQCIRRVPLQHVGENKSHKFYAYGQVAVTPVGSYKVTITSSRGSKYERNFRITAARSWKAVYLAGDYVDNGQPVKVWDNARKEIARLMTARGLSPNNTVHLSRDPSMQSADVGEASLDGLHKAFQKLNIGPSDGCFLFMTSHGSRSSFYIEGGRGISPSDFAQLLDQECGQRPTVAIVSACYAGIMLNQQTKKDNRIIFTAASADRTSNGCAPGVTYTFFDDCIIKSLQNTSVQTYDQLATDIKACIDRKETAANASYPQFFIGNQMKNLPIGGQAEISNEDPSSSDLNNNQEPTNENKIEGAKNLALEGSSGATNLKTVAGSARYLLVDFSSPTCSYCLQFAKMLERQQQYFSSGKCKAVTLVSQGKLNSWLSRLNAYGVTGGDQHSYSLANVSFGQALATLEDSGRSYGSVSTPTILLFDTSLNKVVRKNVGALDASSLRSFIGSECGGN